MTFAQILTTVPGPESVRLFEDDQRSLAPGLQSIALYSRVAFESGQGALLRDVDGNRYIDFFAGVGVASVGHAHPRWVRAVADQAAQLAVGSFATRPRAELGRLLVELAPPGLDRVQFYSSGAEAVEAALRAARSFTKKDEFLGFWGGFHGKTGGVLGLLGDGFKQGLGPLAPGRYLTPYANCYHCAFDQTFPDCQFRCVDFLDSKVAVETTGDLAAIVAEPIQGTAGNVVPPPGYLKRLQDSARKFGALLVCDETITGFGRTGKMFACEHEDVVPDVMIVGKGFGSGYPITGLLLREEIAQAAPYANPSGSSSSFGGNPLAVAAALATLRIIRDEGLVENAERVGAFLLERARGLQQRFPFIGQVWGKGLLVGIELVSDRQSRQKLDKALTRQLFDECLRRGLLIMAYQPNIRIQPPLVLSHEMAEEGIQILEAALDAVANRCLVQGAGNGRGR